MESMAEIRMLGKVERGQRPNVKGRRNHIKDFKVGSDSQFDSLKRSLWL